MRTPLPDHIARAICRELSTNGSFRTLAAFQRSSRSLYDIATPLLYRSLTIRNETNKCIFSSLTPPSKADLDKACRLDGADDTPHPIDFTPNIRILRNLGHVETIFVNEIRDSHALQNLETIDTAMAKTNGSAVFRRLEHVCLLEFAVYQILLHSPNRFPAGSLQRLLRVGNQVTRRATPSTLCMHYPFPSDFDHITGSIPTLWMERDISGMGLTVWAEAILSRGGQVDLHNVTIQTLPLAMSGHLRVHFIPVPESIFEPRRLEAWRRGQVTTMMARSLDALSHRDDPIQTGLPRWTFVHFFNSWKDPRSRSTVEENRERMLREIMTKQIERRYDQARSGSLPGSAKEMWERIQFLTIEEAGVDCPCREIPG